MLNYIRLIGAATTSVPFRFYFPVSRKWYRYITVHNRLMCKRHIILLIPYINFCIKTRGLHLGNRQNETCARA